MKINILDLLLPRETKFFDLMHQMTDLLLESANIFKNLVISIDSMEDYEVKMRLTEIKTCEGRGDDLEHNIIVELHKTFITPLDREDIHTMTINIDRALDILNCISQKFEVYNIHTVPKNVCNFAGIIIEIVTVLGELIDALKKKEPIEEKVKKMHEIENKADHLFHSSMAELFTGKYNPVEIIKLKEVYEQLEEIVDVVDYIGKFVRGMMVKVG
ncbi:TPA: hypothetical protein DEF17_07235 [bacterium]|nr:MAG: hypothetical protein AUJ18_08130 [Candidatus Hydrogenedentes bacterium CG1_02_42_14]HBW47707.1 hypothetical protein [bacterium]